MISLNKKHFFVFILVVFFIFTFEAEAEIYINEIQLSPSGEKFIELYNDGEAQDLTGWSIKRKTPSGNEYPLVSMSRLKDKTISANSYFVIVNEGNYTGSNSFDANWAKSYDIAINNMIYLHDKDGVVVSKIGWGNVSDCDGFSCPSNPPEGKSLQRVSNTEWVISDPTSGGENNSVNKEDEEEDYDSENSSSSSDEVESSQKEEPKVYPISTKIIASKIVTAGIPFDISHQTFGTKKEEVILGRFVWNFGDGMTKELAYSDVFPYIYQYPGDYVLTLSFYDSVFSLKPDATDRIVVKVSEPGISIVSIGTINDPYVEIENKSNHEISLRDFIIHGVSKSFSLPKDMILLPNKKIKLSPKITGFDFSDLSSVSIMDSSGQVFAIYPNKINYRVKKTGVVSTSSVNTKPEVVNNLNDNEVINLNDLEATAVKSKVEISKNMYAWAGLLFIILIGIISIILIRRKDYDVKDTEEISAKDMTIIE